MKRILFTLLCLGILGTVTECSVDPALSRHASGEDGVRTYAPDPYRSTSWKDGWVYQRDDRPYR
jgi:hypothetical protein